MSTSEKIIVRVPERSVIITQKDVDVILGMSHGKTRKEIAAELGLSVRTIEARVGKLIFDLDCKSSVELVSLFFRKKLIV